MPPPTIATSTRSTAVLPRRLAQVLLSASSLAQANLAAKPSGRPRQHRLCLNRAICLIWPRDSQRRATGEPMTIRPRRSVLYMPGSNTRALEKARSLVADALILDLEDAVA